MKRYLLAFALATCLLPTAAVFARDLTTQEKTDATSWLNTINNVNSTPTEVASAKTNLLSKFDILGITGHYWGLFFSSYFTTNAIHEPMAEFLKTAPIDTAKGIEHRRKFQAATVMGAGSRIIELVGVDIDYVAIDMNYDCSVREDVLQAFDVLEVAAHGAPFPDITTAMQNEFYDMMIDFVQNNEPDLKNSVTYDGPTTQPWAGPIRAELYRVIRGIKPTSQSERNFAVDLDLTGVYADILADHNVIVSDNNSMTAGGDTRASAILNLLDSFPPDAEKPVTIAIKDDIGNICPLASNVTYPPAERDAGPGSFGGCNLSSVLAGYSGSADNDRCIDSIGVNIREFTIGEQTRTPFPGTESDLQDTSLEYDAFCEALVHEVSHVLEPNDTASVARRDALIAQACDQDLQYLRSTTGSFCDGVSCGSNPTCDHAKNEFFASIANMYFMDTQKTLDLALDRFDGLDHSTVYKEPLNQFLFFADVLSKVNVGGADTTPFYSQAFGANAECDFASPAQATLARNGSGCITSLTAGGTTYSFTVDSNCNVTAYTD